MGHCKPDIVLRSDTEVLTPTTEFPSALPMLKESCDYILFSEGVVLQTLKKCRKLVVKGSVTNGKLIITVQTGEETPRIFEFENESDFTLIENLKKGDKIVFSYLGTSTVINIKAKIVKAK